MRKTSIGILLYLSIGLMSNLNAQDFRALKFGKYSGLSALDFNPAYHQNENFAWQLRLGGIGINASTNYFKFNNQSIIGLMKDRNDLIDGIQNSVTHVDDVDSILNIQYLDPKTTRANIEGQILGPALAIQFNEHRIGLFSNVKSISFIKGLPNWREANVISDLNSGDSFTFKNNVVSILNWLEIGLNYASSLEKENGKLHLGLNLKSYQGFDLVMLRSLNENIATKRSGQVDFENAEFDAYLFTGFQHDTNGSNQYQKETKGNGLGLDLGFIYEMKSNQSKNDQNIRIGVSLSDIGYIRFKNGDYHHFTLVNGSILKDQFFDEYPTWELEKDLDIIDKNYIKRDNQASIAMPASIQLFLDYPISNHWSINIATRQNLPGFSSIQRSTFLAVSPSFDTKWLGVSMPLSIYNNKNFNVGTALRLGPLILGSDHFLGWFVPSNLNQANAYLALNLNSEMFDFIRFPKRGKSRRKSKSQKNVECYYF